MRCRRLPLTLATITIILHGLMVIVSPLLKTSKVAMFVCNTVAHYLSVFQRPLLDVIGPIFLTPVVADTKLILWVSYFADNETNCPMEGVKEKV